MAEEIPVFNGVGHTEGLVELDISLFIITFYIFLLVKCLIVVCFPVLSGILQMSDIIGLPAALQTPFGRFKAPFRKCLCHCLYRNSCHKEAFTKFVEFTVRQYKRKMLSEIPIKDSLYGEIIKDVLEHYETALSSLENRPEHYDKEDSMEKIQERN